MKTQFLITIALVIVLYPVIATAASWAGFRAAGLRVKTVSFFRGPRLLSGTVFGDPVEVGWFPIGSSLQWVPEQYYSQSRWRRLGVALIGPVLGLATAAMLLGPTTAMHHIGSGFLQIILGALHPRTIGVELITHLQTAFSQSPATAIGILIAKGLADDFLPIGGSTVTNCLSALGNASRQDNRAIVFFTTLSALTAIGLLASWFVAVLAYALTTNP